MVALGIALVALCGLGGAWLASRGVAPQTVVVAASPLQAGQPIQGGDLATTQLTGGQGLSTIPGSRLESLVGEYPVVDIPAGSLLSPAQLVDEVTPGPGRSILGVGVTAAQMPAIGLAGGDRVRLVTTHSTQGGDVEPGQSWRATVVAVGPVSDNGSRTVDVSVDSSDAVAAASAAGGGAVAIVLDGPEGGG